VSNSEKHEHELEQKDNLIAEELEECGERDEVEEHLEGNDMEVLYIDTKAELDSVKKHKENMQAVIAAIIMLAIGLVVFVIFNWGGLIRDRVMAMIQPTPTPTEQVAPTANPYTTLDPGMTLSWKLSATPDTLNGDNTVSKTQVALEFNGELYIVGQYPGVAEEIAQPDYAKYGIPQEALLAVKCVLETGTDYLYVIRNSASELYVMHEFVDTMITLAPGETNQFTNKAIIPIKNLAQPTEVPEMVEASPTPGPTIQNTQTSGSTVADGEGEGDNTDVGAVEATLAPDGGGLG
jgi:hypothetical protein